MSLHYEVGVREIVVGVAVALLGAFAHAYLTISSVEAGFSSHVSREDIHAPLDRIDQKLEDQQRQLDNLDGKIEDIERQNDAILQGLGRLEGIVTRPEHER